MPKHIWIEQTKNGYVLETDHHQFDAEKSVYTSLAQAVNAAIAYFEPDSLVEVCAQERGEEVA